MLLTNKSCTYYGMTINSKPICSEDGIWVNIQNDNTSELCDVSKKRVDSQWGSWESETTVDTSLELKVITRRTRVISPAHGGKESGDKNENQISSWLLFVKEGMTWTDAKLNCENLGGELFHRINGTQEQLQLLRTRMDYENHWVGIYTENHETWKTVAGKVSSTIEKIL